MKRIITVLIIVCMLAMGLTGCGESGPSAQDTAEAFMEALKAGDTAKVSEISDPGILGRDFDTLNKISDYIDEYLGYSKITKADLDEAAVASLDGLELFVIGNFIASYEMSEIEENGSEPIEADVKITFGYDYETVKDAIDNAFSDAASAYIEEHPDVTEKLSAAEEEEYKSLVAAAMNAITQDACDKTIETLSAAEAQETDFVLSITKGDEGWRVTGIKRYGDLGEIEEISRQFLDAFVSGDLDKAKDCSSDQAWKSAYSATDIIMEFKEDQLASFKSEEVFKNYEPNEEVLSAIDQYVSAVMSKWISEYEITEVTIDEKGRGKVGVSKKGKKIVYTYEQYLEGRVAEICRLALESLDDEGKAVREEMGEEAFYKVFYDEGLPYVYQSLTKELDSLDDNIYSVLDLRVEKVDGNWLVTWITEF